MKLGLSAKVHTGEGVGLGELHSRALCGEGYIGYSDWGNLTRNISFLCHSRAQARWSDTMSEVEALFLSWWSLTPCSDTV